MTTRLTSRLVAVAAAALIGSSMAAAEPRHGHHGHHHHHGGGDIVMGIAALKGQLNLNTSQQAMWDNTMAAGKAAREGARANMRAVHATLTAELAKAEPALAAVAAATDNARAANATVHRQVRDAWLGLYATFTPDQKAVVKTAVQERLARSEQSRETARERHSQGG